MDRFDGENEDGKHDIILVVEFVIYLRPYSACPVSSAFLCFHTFSLAEIRYVVSKFR